jgi:hypothetical protein
MAIENARTSERRRPRPVVGTSAGYWAGDVRGVHDPDLAALTRRAIEARAAAEWLAEPRE